MRGFSVFALLAIACVAVAAVGGALVWRWVEAPVKQEIHDLDADSLRFAAEHDQTDCTPEALRRLEACDGLWCRMKAPIFARTCLRLAHPSPGLCDGVPTSPLRATLWPIQRCAEGKLEPQMCRRIWNELLEACLARAQPSARSRAPS